VINASCKGILLGTTEAAPERAYATNLVEALVTSATEHTEVG
jgi:hypothetical protein